MDVRVYDARARVVARDSTAETVALGSPDTLGRVHTWRLRLPRDAQMWRVEALQPDRMRAARSVGPISADTAQGLAMSDVLVAASVAPRPGVGGGRWSDFTIAPSAGRFGQGQPISLLWETYGLARRPDGSSWYRVTVMLERASAGQSSLLARVLGGAGPVAGLVARGKRKLSLSFERSTEARPISVDYLAIDVAQLPPDEWRLTVEVRDLVTDQVSRVARRLTIVARAY